MFLGWCCPALNPLLQLKISENLHLCVGAHIPGSGGTPSTEGPIIQDTRNWGLGFSATLKSKHPGVLIFFFLVQMKARKVRCTGGEDRPPVTCSPTHPSSQPGVPACWGACMFRPPPRVIFPSGSPWEEPTAAVPLAFSETFVFGFFGSDPGNRR